jgi:peptide deformylase
MKLPIHYFGDPVLRARGEPIESITPEIIQLAHDMIETMIANNGVGLAGPQVGKKLRIYIFRDEWVDKDGKYQLGEPVVVINPVLSNPSKETETQLEGCLSLPGLHVEVERPLSLHIRYQNLKGEFVETTLKGFLARVNAHENDHLNGTLHIDRASPKEKKQMEPVLREIKKKYAPK